MCTLLGYYILERGREVNESPVWKQSNGNNFLARAGSTWMVQTGSDVGKGLVGNMHLLDDTPLPHKTELLWREWLDDTIHLVN